MRLSFGCMAPAPPCGRRTSRWRQGKMPPAGGQVDSLHRDSDRARRGELAACASNGDIDVDPRLRHGHRETVVLSGEFAERLSIVFETKVRGRAAHPSFQHMSAGGRTDVQVRIAD